MAIKLGFFLSASPSSGGMFQYAQSLLVALSKADSKKYQILIVYRDLSWQKILESLGFDGVYLSSMKLGIFLADSQMFFHVPALVSKKIGRFFNPLVRDLLRLNCDYWIFPSQDSLSYQLPVKSIGTIHDLMHIYEPFFPEVKSKFRYFVREHRFRNIAHECSAVLVDSEVGKRHVVESYRVSGRTIFPLPYVCPGYLKELDVRKDFDSHYQLPKKFLFYPAQFWAHKNHKRLLDAIKSLSLRYKDIALVMSGGFNHEYSNLVAQAKELNISHMVYFVGHVPDSDMRGFYERARALVMPTFFGPTNIPPLEAIAVGCPALVSNIYGMPEQLGNAAMYFDPNSVESIATSIAKIWLDDRLCEKLRSNGLQWSQGYDEAEFESQLFKILGHLS